MATTLEIAKRIIQFGPVRVLLAGPVGIGKTSLANDLVTLDQRIKHIELDQLKDIKPCWIGFFSLSDCLEPKIKDVDTFVIDVGGDSIFREKVDNKERLQSLIRFRERHDIKIILLSAPRGVVKSRYLKFPGSFEEEFSGAWDNWLKVGLPFWTLSCDNEIDVSES